jgi:hypothetical protein
MDEPAVEPGQGALEERSRALFRDSVDKIDMPMRSRLTQARYAALAAAPHSGRRAWLTHLSLWRPAVGMTAAAALGIALWFGTPLGSHGPFGLHGVVSADSQSNFEDLDLVASSDESSGDAMEMLQEDIDFYDWADKAATAEPAA